MKQNVGVQQPLPSPRKTLTPRNETGIKVTTVPSQMELARLAAAVSPGMRKKPDEAVSYALELWRESAAALQRVWEKEGAYLYDISIAKNVVERLEAQKKNLPMPDNFPATLDDFLRLIVQAKTPADCHKRLRDCLEDRYKNFKEKPQGAYTIEQIRDGDKEGGFFTPDLWRVLGNSYLGWWKYRKSQKARESAKRSAEARAAATQRRKRKPPV